ncbi:MAG: hypothetical protein PWP39_1759 [Pyrococcus sp.]|nr:hypothetical protein [Pyrococcus sp.]
MKTILSILTIAPYEQTDIYVCGNGEREYWEHAYKVEELILKVSEYPISMKDALQLVDKESLAYLVQNSILKRKWAN